MHTNCLLKVLRENCQFFPLFLVSKTFQSHIFPSGNVKFVSKMGTFSEIGIGLSIVFGFLLLALVAELYYLLWWKKKFSRREIQSSQIITEHEYSNYVKELTQIFRWKKSPPHLPTAVLGGESEVKGGGEEVNADDLLLKAFGGEEGVEAELMRLHNLAGPPRFLFTINEESKEDLESEDGRKGSRTGSVMSDVVLTIDTPNFLSPLASPMSKSNLNPLNGVHHGINFNPLFESSEVELRSSSPPPKFKFLRDAEEKLLRRILIEEAEKRLQKNPESSTVRLPERRLQKNCSFATESSTVGPHSSLAEANQGSFLKFIVGKNNEQLQCLPQPQQCPSSSAQVLPLSSSPITFRSVEMNSSVH